MSALILPDAERHEVRKILTRGVDLLMAHPAEVHYTQDLVERWSAIDGHLRIARGEVLRKGDCSSTTTWLLWNGLTHVHHHADVVNGEHYRAGFTGTQVAHGRIVRHPGNFRLGDLVFYGGTASRPEHVAMYVGGGKVFSHGGEAGPFILGLDYRGDRHPYAHRYF